MALSPEEVGKIAHLSRLNLTSDDLTNNLTQLSKILNFVQQMDAIDTTAIEPLSHPFEMTQRLRADVVTEKDLREKYQQAAPLVEVGLYLVPKVIDEV